MPYSVWRLRRRKPAPVLLSAGESALLNAPSRANVALEVVKRLANEETV